MKKRALMLALCFVATAIPVISYADDTDVYNIAQDVRPNVLIIFDNSGSMDAYVPYDAGTTYSGTYDPTKCYERQCVDWYWWWCTDWDWVEIALDPDDMPDTNNDGIHDNDSDIKTGNRLNFESDTSATQKLTIAKNAVKDVIEKTKDYVRFGIMVLNGAEDINVSWDFPAYHSDTTTLDQNQGGAVIADRTDAEIDDLLDQVSNMDANGGTPLANRLINAAQYFRGDFGSYASPIDATNWCRKNFVIIMTDGKPEGEGNSLGANNNGDYDFIEDFMDANAGTRDFDSDGDDPDTASDNYVQGGSDYLNDVAGYLYKTEDSLDPLHNIEGNQNLTVFTIGFTVGFDLLQSAAEGQPGDEYGGNYYTASNADDLAEALIQTLITIIEGAQIFTAPVVPVQRTTSGDKIYISLFAPKTDENFWPGYLLKLDITSNANLMAFDTDYGTGASVAATDADGNLYPNLLNDLAPPYPHWDAQYKLKTRSTAREIYTIYAGSPTDLIDPDNAFVTTNSAITSDMLGNPMEGSNPREDLINYIRGMDAYDEDGDTVVGEKRDEILGDILHARPLVISYSDTETVIYAGTNDGMLHAFDDSTGSEKWAFIPPDLLPKLKNIVEGTGHQYYIDGSPKAYILDHDGDGDIETPDQDTNYDKVIIIFGERRGGTSYCALDVSDPDDPQYLWRIDNASPTITGIRGLTTEIAELGESWSEPVVGKVKVDTTDTIVAFIGGGFNDTIPDHTKGRGLFIIDVLSGALLKSYTSVTYPVLAANMTYSIPSTVTAVDTTLDDYINRVYVGDTGGQMWRFGFQRATATDTDPEDGNINTWEPRLLFRSDTSSPPERKIFYPPDLVLEYGYDYLYFGTGDRTDPGKATVSNRIYAVKDRNKADADFSTLNESNLENVTDDILQDPTSTPTDIQDKLTNLYTKDGWYIILEDTGEKVLAAPVVFYGTAMFTTFTPNTDPCSYGGEGRVYAMDYLTATAVLNFDTTNIGLQKTDRFLTIGSGIPTEVVIFISGGGANVKPRWLVGGGGGGGGVFGGGLPTDIVTFIRDSWKEL